MAIVIDERILGDCSWPHTLENFNRVYEAIDTIADTVAELEESKLFKIKFDSDGGSAVGNQYAIRGETIVEPEDPTKEGFIFAGWYDGETEFDFTTEIESHLTLTAKWDPEETEE